MKYKITLPKSVEPITYTEAIIKAEFGRTKRIKIKEIKSDYYNHIVFLEGPDKTITKFKEYWDLFEYDLTIRLERYKRGFSTPSNISFNEKFYLKLNIFWILTLFIIIFKVRKCIKDLKI